MDLDDPDNETPRIYYNDKDVTDTGCAAYDLIMEKMKSGKPEGIIFKPLPKTEPTSSNGKVCSANPSASDGYIHSYPLGSTAYYDLDGNGSEDEIMLTINDGTIIINVNGVTKKVEAWLFDTTGYYSIVNINTAEESLLVSVSDYGPSSDEMTYLFSYNGKDIIFVDRFDQVLGKNDRSYEGAICNGDGTISGSTRMEVLGTWFASVKYRYADGCLRDITEFHENLWESEMITKRSVVLYSELHDFNYQVIIPAGTVVSMTGCIQDGASMYWVAFESDSFEGRLWAFAMTEEYPHFIHSVHGVISSEEAFDGVYFAD